MPVILGNEAQLLWLNKNASEESAFELLKSYPASLMEMKEVPKPPRKKKIDPSLSFDF